MIDNDGGLCEGSVMAAKTMNISLTPELKAGIEARVKSGQYGDASDVVRAGLRALAREELGASLQHFQEIMARLPADPRLTPELEQDVERRVRASRSAAKAKGKV